MARALNRLTALKVSHAKKRGRYSDGGGLYLAVDEGLSKRWVFLFTLNGKARMMGLGSINAVSLEKARRKAAEARALVADGVDPIVQRRQEQSRVGVPTFGELADQLLPHVGGAWRSPKHRKEWRKSLCKHAAKLEGMHVDAIGAADVLAVLQPIWLAIPETARRVRGRVEAVLDAAKARGLRDGENPARWKGHLDHLLAKHRPAVQHFAALPYEQMPAFLGQLREQQGVGPLALEFAILTACRSGEVLKAQWSEIDREARLWVIPAERTKRLREHRVPLSDRCLAILDELSSRPADPVFGREFVFPGALRGKPLGASSMESVLRRMNRSDITVHGFRSAFRTWVSETTDVPDRVAEEALGHVFGSAVERSYRRGDLFERRRELMQAWSRHCEPRQVVPLRVVS
jgi:integrase